jgi:hypothetical protein
VLAARLLCPVAVILSVEGMSAVTSEPPDQLTVRPGDEVGIDIVVRNVGQVVDSYAIEPLGPLAAWMRAEPDVLPLMPGTEGVVRLTFAPPRSAQVPAGDAPWAVRLVPSEDPDGATVQEGMLSVEAFSEVTAEMRPRTSHARGRRRGRHQLAMDNLGNCPVEVFLAAGDPERSLDVAVTPAAMTLPAGGVAVVDVRARARKRFWRGQPVTRPFQVVVEPGGQQPTVVDGSLLQETVVPAWLLKLVAALALLAAVLVALWLTVLRPTIDDRARAIATKEATKATGTEAEARKAADKTAADDAAARQEETQQQIDALPKTGEPKGGVPSTTVDPLGNPVTHRLAASAGQPSPSLVLDTRRVTYLTDLLLQNPNGDSGTIDVRRDGRTVYEARLENFRDLDLHLVAPIQVRRGGTLSLKVDCTNPNPAGAARTQACSPALTVQGFARAVR